MNAESVPEDEMLENPARKNPPPKVRPQLKVDNADELLERLLSTVTEAEVKRNG